MLREHGESTAITKLLHVLHGRDMIVVIVVFLKAEAGPYGAGGAPHQGGTSADQKCRQIAACLCSRLGCAVVVFDHN